MWQICVYVPEGNQSRHENYADLYADPLSLLKVGDSHHKGPWQTEVIDASSFKPDVPRPFFHDSILYA